VTESTAETPILQEALSRYLHSLNEKNKGEVAVELMRFGRWFDEGRLLRTLRPADIERYGEEASKNPVDAQRRLEAVRGFLQYAKRQSWTDANLAVHLRLRRTGTGDSSKDVAASDRIEVTAEGLAALKAELDTLTAQRPQIAEELRLAMADKDFRENAPLDVAREKQGHLEARIRELEATIKRAAVVDHVSSEDASGRARMGCRVRLRRLDTGQELQYTLVGPGEVNAGQGRISIKSPVGSAVVNRAAGDEVEVSAPSGVIRFQLVAVEF
jgi:transcription elongation factor GreA